MGRCLRMNINSTMMSSATCLGVKWQSSDFIVWALPLTQSVQLRYCQLAPVTFSSVRRRPPKTDVANEIGNIPESVELDSSSSPVPTASSSSLELQTMIPKFATPWCSDSSCDEKLHAKTIGLARSASDRFPSTTSGGSIQLQGSWELRVSSIHGQIHECLALRRSN